MRCSFRDRLKTGAFISSAILSVRRKVIVVCFRAEAFLPERSLRLVSSGVPEATVVTGGTQKPDNSKPAQPTLRGDPQSHRDHHDHNRWAALPVKEAQLSREA